MTRFLPTALLSSAVLLSIAVFASPAQAENSLSEQVTLTYEIADLNSEYGANTVLKSLEIQARDACSSITPILRKEQIDADCVANVLDQAVYGIANDVLTAAYQRSSILALRVAKVENTKG